MCTCETADACPAGAALKMSVKQDVSMKRGPRTLVPRTFHSNLTGSCVAPPLILSRLIAGNARAWEKFRGGSLLDSGPLPLPDRDVVQMHDADRLAGVGHDQRGDLRGVENVQRWQAGRRKSSSDFLSSPHRPAGSSGRPHVAASPQQRIVALFRVIRTDTVARLI